MKNKMRLVLALAVSAWGVGTANAATVTTYNDSLDGNVIYGSGNVDGNFTIGTNGNVEIGLRARPRSTGPIAPDSGTGTYHIGLNTLWNFDWSVNSNLGLSVLPGEPVGGFLSTYTYLLELDTDATQGFNWLGFDPISSPLGASYFDNAMGFNTTTQNQISPGNNIDVDINDIQGTLAAYDAALDIYNVAQNSWRYQFVNSPNNNWIPGFPNLNLGIDGTYGIRLSAFDTNGVIASQTISVVVGAGGGPAVVPIPAAAPLGLLGMGLVAFVRRRKNAKA